MTAALAYPVSEATRAFFDRPLLGHLIGEAPCASVTGDTMAAVRALNDIAWRRGQSLAQMALAWALRDPRMTSVVIGASSVRQLEDNLGALNNLDFTDAELAEIDQVR